MQKSGDFPLFAAKILVASSLKMWHNSPVQIHICSGIEVVITGLTRNQFGSNPTRVRIPPAAPRRSKLYIACSDFFYKSQNALMPLLLLSKSQPLRWVVIWFWQILWITASILFGLHTSSRMSYHSRRRFFTSSLIHSIAPPFQIEPTALGFDLVLART